MEYSEIFNFVCANITKSASIAVAEGVAKDIGLMLKHGFSAREATMEIAKFESYTREEAKELFENVNKYYDV